MATLEETQAAIAKLRAERDEREAAARDAVSQRRVLREELASLARRDPRGSELDRIERRLAELERANGAQRKRADDLAAEIRNHASGLLRVSLDELFGQLDDHVPLLMLPVRLETKYAPDAPGRGAALRVRIFPDDIHVSTHDPSLSGSEIESGTNYWAERTRALGLPAGQRRDAELGAWSLIAKRCGGPRARYVARTTKPVGWPTPGGAPAPFATRDSMSGTPPRARMLPDFFVVTALASDGTVLARETGKAIPDSLQLGPDPEAPAAAFKHDADKRIVADPKLAWLTDYASAVEAGMAVTLTLPSRLRIARVVALGVRFSLTPADAAAAVERLFSEHRFTNGIDLLPQGTPTNNTDGAESGFTTDLAADEALVEQEVNGRVAVEVLDHATKGDAQRLAEALGIAFEHVRDWPSADAADVAHGLAMNRALWPATFGTYLKDLIGGQLPARTKAEIERFFLTYVTGRNLLPSIRIGTQPYGVLATSDLRSWSESRRDDAATPSVLDGLRWFRQKFEAAEASPDRDAQLGTGREPLKTTMKVIGHQASSVAFGSRKAVEDRLSWSTLQFTGTVPHVMASWFEILNNKRETNAASLGLSLEGMPLAKLVFFGHPDPFTGPIIDQDPEVPLSETAKLSKHDGARNYIEWLLNASSEDLRAEKFVAPDGARVAPPKALLYRMLHHAWTVRLVDVTKGILTRLRPQAVSQAAFASSMTNIGADKVLPDTHASSVSTAKLGLTQNASLLGDFVLDAARSGAAIALEQVPEALPLQSQRDAVARLASLTTAQLERLFAEHIDLASHRLDAWQTGLVAQRLDEMRRREGRGRGVYLGAYGYVEDLVPKETMPVIDPKTLPEGLRGPEPVREQAGNGGFVHAPSLMHGVTAAVLRNAYLTHADPELRETMSVNLTSRRVRMAMSLIEGMRAGQDLAALLGYQLERGLHEHHRGIELDEFIYVLRERFPLVSRRLTPVPDGTPAEQIEARNVVDGYELIEHIRAHPGFPHGLPLPDTGSAANAIHVEFQRIEEALDSVSDLLTAESVHQAVQSNIDRARGALAAVTDGEMPPVPDVVQTPRSGRAFTQRVALHLPAAGSSATPRSQANPRLDAWLVTRLPPLEDIGVEIHPPTGAPESLTLDETGLAALDLVLMSGDRLGDGSSELERFLADHWRTANAIPDDVVTVYSASAPPPAGVTNFIRLDATAGAPQPLARLLPQLRALRRLIGSARGLDAQDYRIPTDETDTPANPRGFVLDGAGNLAGLPARLAAARAGLANELATLVPVLDDLKTAYDKLRAEASTFDATVWKAGLDKIRPRLLAIAPYGVPEAWPRSVAEVSVRAALVSYEQGRAVEAAVAQRVAQADAALVPVPPGTALSDPKAEARRQAARLERSHANLVDAARRLFGPNFPVQAAFALGATARIEIDARRASPVETDALRIEGWLQGLARVRTRMADLSLVCAATQWTTGREPDLVPVQLPLRAGDPWIGLGWSAAKPPAAGDILSVMAVDPAASFAGDLEGLLLDDWTETVPTTEETTGIVFHYDRPNAAAPQALLLAAPPAQDGRWRWQELLGTVTDTFDRARLRTIEPDDLQDTPLFQLLPATMAPFTEIHGLATMLVNREFVALARED